jgi:hypothetical protein
VRKVSIPWDFSAITEVDTDTYVGMDKVERNLSSYFQTVSIGIKLNSARIILDSEHGANKNSTLNTA